MATKQDAAPATPDPPQTFDQRVCDRLKAAFADVFLAFPEVKCLAATITWNGGLNDAQINHGVWLDAGGGPVRTADGLVGSLFQTLRMLDAQTARLAAYAKTTAERVQVLGTDLVKKLEELETVRAEVEALRGGDAGG